MNKIIKEERIDKIDIKKHGVSYDKRGNLFSVEISQLRGLRFGLEDKVILFNPKTNGEMTFKFDDVDRYGSGEDEEIAGWRYKSLDGKYYLLILND